LELLLGVDIGGTNVKAGLVSGDGTVVASSMRGWSGGEPDEAVSLAARLAGELTGAHPEAAPTRCGTGCAGLVDGHRGTVLRSPNLPTWHDVELKAMLSAALGLRTLVDNDANAAAYAEYVLGAARGARSAVVITLGTGVGGGIVIDGRVYRGAHGFAGEIGHAVIDIDGAACACGGSGCLEGLVNARSLVARANEAIEEGARTSLADVARERTLTAKDVGDAAGRGDAVAGNVVAETGRVLGAGLANLIQVLDPDVIVVGGGVAAVGEPLLAPAREEMAARACGRGPNLPRVTFAELGELAGMVGAALLARDELDAA